MKIFSGVKETREEKYKGNYIIGQKGKLLESPIAVVWWRYFFCELPDLLWLSNCTTANVLAFTCNAVHVLVGLKLQLLPGCGEQQETLRRSKEIFSFLSCILFFWSKWSRESGLRYEKKLTKISTICSNKQETLMWLVMSYVIQVNLSLSRHCWTYAKYMLPIMNAGIC